MLKKFLNGVCAGIVICLGGGVFLAAENKVVGSVLFAVALLCICVKGYSLFTGRICYIPEKHDKEAFSVLLLGLLGNLAGTFLGGLLIRTALPHLAETAKAICTAKLGQSFFSALIRGVFCGILIYLAVDLFKNKTISGILFCIPVFILSGYEHSIADMYYFAVSSIVSLRAFGFIWMVIFGNTIGGMLLPILSMANTDNK